MANFIAKNDWFGLADDVLVTTSDEMSYSESMAEPTCQDGSFLADACFAYAPTFAPSNDYLQKATWSKQDGEVKLGQVKESEYTAKDGSKLSATICLNALNIGTAAGSAPTVVASGESIEDKGTAGCTYSIPAFSLPKQHHAFILFNAFTLSGAGCCLKSASYAAACTVSKATKDGVCIAHDVTEGRIDASVEILQTGSAQPTLTPGDGWIVTSQLTQSNPDADYPTWSATLTKYLSKD